MRYGSDLDLVFLYGAGGESDDRRRSPGVVRPRLAAVHRDDGGDAGGGAPLSGRHPAPPLGRAGAAGDLLGLVRALPPRGVGRLGAGGALAGAHRLDRRAGAARDARGRALAAIAFTARRRRDAFAPISPRARARCERERGKVPEGSRHLRFDPGGIMDVELLVALGQLRHAADPRDPHHLDGGGARSAGDAGVAGCAARRLRRAPPNGAAAAPAARPAAGGGLAARSAGAGPQPGDDADAARRRARRADGPGAHRVRQVLSERAAPAAGATGSVPLLFATLPRRPRRRSRAGGASPRGSCARCPGSRRPSSSCRWPGRAPASGTRARTP